MSFENGDNLFVSVRASQKESLELAIQIAFNFHNNKAAISYYIDKKFGIVFERSIEEKSKRSISIPFKMDAKKAADFAWNWLQDINYKDYEYQGMSSHYDGEADNKKGFEVYVEDWGHVNGASNAICGIRPAYIWIGK